METKRFNTVDFLFHAAESMLGGESKPNPINRPGFRNVGVLSVIERRPLPLRAEARVLGATLKPSQDLEYIVAERRDHCMASPTGALCAQPSRAA